jgi:hypothetical protein
LSEHVVDFEKRSTIKSQILADFITAWMELASYTEGLVTDSSWQMYCDVAWGSIKAWGHSSPGITLRDQIEIRDTTTVRKGNRQVYKQYNRVQNNIVRASQAAGHGGSELHVENIFQVDRRAN